jgi:hypothetical protein
MKKVRCFALIANVVLCVAFASALPASAQINTKPEVEKLVFWSDAATGTEVFLSVEGRLTVISEKTVRVDYHTKINSSIPVDDQLAITGSLGTSVKYFAVKHHFSRTTIWMTLEFTIGGEKVPSLTRTFYDSIFETVPNERFFKPGGKLKP